MKVYACYSPSHLPLVEQHFRPSLPPDLEPCYLELPQTGSGIYGTREFNLTTKHKFEWVLKAIKETATLSTPFLFSDVDVRFYGPVANDLLTLLRGRDIVFQDQGPAGACTGFFVVVPSQRTTKFFEEALERIDDHHHDQDAANLVLRTNTSLKWGLLPERYYMIGRQENRWVPMLWEKWDPQTMIWIPKDLLVHHANWTQGIPNKLRLLETVKKLLEKRKTN